MIDTVLFDLDGTLLPMDQDKFVETYMGLLAAKIAPCGYEPRGFVKNVWQGTKAMVMNRSGETNEKAFWNVMTEAYGDRILDTMPMFEEFYANEFCGARTACGFAPEAARTIAMLKENGIRCALATNPLFPEIATRQRVRWAGLNWEDFDLVTTYENSTRCKPNPEYYAQVLEKLGKKPEQCIMVGNDVGEDMIAGSLGMKVFLLTDCLINKSGGLLDPWPHGGFAELQAFLKENM